MECMKKRISFTVQLLKTRLSFGLLARGVMMLVLGLVCFSGSLAWAQKEDNSKGVDILRGVNTTIDFDSVNEQLNYESEVAVINNTFCDCKISGLLGHRPVTAGPFSFVVLPRAAFVKGETHMSLHSHVPLGPDQIKRMNIQQEEKDQLLACHAYSRAGGIALPKIRDSVDHFGVSFIEKRYLKLGLRADSRLPSPLILGGRFFDRKQNITYFTLARSLEDESDAMYKRLHLKVMPKAFSRRHKLEPKKQKMR